jgi:hypothetical protein
MNDNREPILVRATDNLVVAAVETRAEVLTYPQALLAMARTLIGEGQFSLAVIVCHVACEVATERSMVEAYAKKGLQDLGEAVEEFLNGYNLAIPRNRKLYTALTGDQIGQQPFWETFKASATRRNQILHGRLPVGEVTQGDAEESFKAASNLVVHLKQ